MFAAFLIGVIAGLRTMTAPAAVSWAVKLGALKPRHAALAFLGSTFTLWVLTLLALAELVVDQLRTTSDRRAPVPFGARMASGAVSGAGIAASGGSLAGGLVVGAAGALTGTLAGYAFRARLAATFGRDRPAAFVEDAIAIGGALVILAWLE